MASLLPCPATCRRPAAEAVLTLVFLGRLEAVAGGSSRRVPLAGTLDAVFAGLEPDLVAALRAPRIKLAVNGTLVAVGAAMALHDGDELAFLPPVSGG